MFQVGSREPGQCFFGCPKATEVVKFVKDRQTVNLCRGCLWKALNGTAANSGRPKQEAKTE